MLQNAATVGQNAQQIQMQMQSPQMHGAHQNNVVRMQHSDHPGVQNNHEQIKMSPPQKPMTLPPLQTAADQQSNSPSINPQTPTMIESVGEVDWREKLFQSITTLKAAHFSELMDLDKTMIQRKLTDDELQSLPEKEAKSYKFREKVKTKTMTALNFLQIQKSHIDEHTEEKFHRQENTIKFLISLHRERNDKIAGMIGSRQSQECHDLRQLLQTPNHPTDDPSQSSPPNPSRDQRDDEQEKTEETSISQSVHNYNCDDTTTPSIDSVPQQNNTNNDNLAGQSEDEAAVVPKKRPIDHLIDSDAAAAAAQSPAMEVQQIDTACFMCLEQRPYYDHHLLNGEFKPQKRQKTDNNDSPLQREIDAINDKLIDTVITIVTDDVVGKEDDETKKTHPKAKPTTIKFRYTAVSVSPEVRQLLTSSAGSSLVKEMKLSVPADYPQSSPVIVEYEQPQGGRYGEIAQAVEAAFRRALGELPQPMSIEQMARAWDAAVRGVVTEIAQRDGGGTFSSEYGEWESCE
uniref:ARC105/Med15 mediator subunit C-terminal domain-containing protein n=1 Tax=Leersia perrieri TaxID=77586 RepID=A0A0D9XY73_9ORYZ